MIWATYLHYPCVKMVHGFSGASKVGDLSQAVSSFFATTPWNLMLGEESTTFLQNH